MACIVCALNIHVIPVLLATVVWRGLGQFLGTMSPCPHVPNAQCQATVGHTSPLSINSALYKTAFDVTCNPNGKEAATEWMKVVYCLP